MSGLSSTMIIQFLMGSQVGLKGIQRLSNLFEIWTKKITKGEIIAVGKDKCRAFAETAMFS